MGLSVGGLVGRSVGDGGSIDISEGIVEAITQFDVFDIEDPVRNSNVEKKIVLISYCNPTDGNVCDYVTQLNEDEIESIVINIGPSVSDDQSQCLINANSNDDLFSIPSIDSDGFNKAIDDIRGEICSVPTPSPTDRPTKPPTDRPTKPPTDRPTKPPTDRPTKPPTDRPTKPPTNKPTKPPTNKPTKPPTNKPTKPPTNKPTKPPTNRPTKPPTDRPTKPPTSKPTKPPTDRPTKSPTDRPTPSPLTPPCSFSDNTDIAFVIDTGCYLTQQQCNDRNALLSELVQRVYDVNQVSVTVIRYSASSSVVLSFDASTREAAILAVESLPCDGIGNVNIESGVSAAIDALDGRLSDEKKLILLSYCRQTEGDVCILSGELADLEIEVITINTDDIFNTGDNECLVNEGEDSFDLPNLDDVSEPTIEDIQAEVCSKPTPSPTPMPTNRPTKPPTDRPTKPPTNRPTKPPTDRPTKPPTGRPTKPPTNRPTKPPTNRPTKPPTNKPTKLPTDRPTKAPTDRPTKPPTDRPTPSPLTPPCSFSDNTDIAFVVDTGCYLNQQQCNDRNALLSELVQRVYDVNQVSVSVIRYRASASVVLSFDVSTREAAILAVESLPCDGIGDVNIESGVSAAINEFDGRLSDEKKLILLSYCRQTEGDVCRLSDELADLEIEVITINTDDIFNTGDNECLVNEGEDSFDLPNLDDVSEPTIEDIQSEVCSKPTPSPTPMPTDRPTKPPTDRPTKPPTNKPTKPPTDRPTKPPTDRPTKPPTDRPTKSPTKWITPSPTKWITPSPTKWITPSPTKWITPLPTKWVTPAPSKPQHSGCPYVPACSSDPCPCYENPYCMYGQCKSNGCNQCQEGTFKKGDNYPCINCYEVFGQGCSFCNDKFGCAQCKVGYHRVDILNSECGLSYCVECAHQFEYNDCSQQT